jgi:RND family efflux transporter MFP subunit
MKKSKKCTFGPIRGHYTSTRAPSDSAAKLTTANSRKLLQNRVISPSELALHESAETEAAAGLAAAKVEVARAQLKLDETKVMAPIDGRVSRIQHTEGNLITGDQTVILTVMATDTLYVSFDVPEATLLRLRRDGLAEPGKLNVAIGFADEEGHPHPAQLDLIASEINPKTGTVRFRATAPNPKGIFLPGMSARVRLSAAVK